MATYSIETFGRRELLKMSAVVAGFGTIATATSARTAELSRTPSQILGPFYPVTVLPRTTDLTKVAGRPGRAQGQVLNVMGRVLNLSGEPAREATVEVWQANAYGRYSHPGDRNPVPLDPYFEGAAVLTTDADGRYRFTTIKPAAYPAGPNLMRPAHIHFQVSSKRDRLVTQMYFDGDPHNATDSLLNTAGRKDLLITKMVDATPEFEPGSKTVVFDIVLYSG
jgi:protocatechuate 3,4-dioxygenase beta subunit